MENAAQNGVGEAIPQMTAEEAVAHIRSQLGDQTKWRRRQRGFVDWKFGELAEYLGYQRALDYVCSMHRWYDYNAKYKAKCLLDETFERFVEASS